MTKIRLQFVHEFTDRHGKMRRYFRRPGFKRVPLPGLPGSAEFMAAYQAALDGATAPPVQIGASRTKPGTINALCVVYYNSAAYKGLDDGTKDTYRGIIERFRREHGEKRVALLGRDHIKKMLAAKANTPAAAKNWLRMVRMLMQLAVEEGMRQDDPTFRVKAPSYNSQGFYTWTEDDIATFEAKHPLGTKARLAMALMLYTSGRRSDAVRFGRQHIRSGWLTYTQQKNRKRKPVTLSIPVHPELQKVIDATPSDHLTFLVTKHGKPYTAAGFGNWMRERCDEAGLPDCSSHGLRKAVARRLAEAGKTPHEIKAITGHKTLKEIERYTAAVDQKRLAARAMDVNTTPTLVETGTSSGKPT